MVIRDIKFPSETISAFCTRHHIGRLVLFGSVLHEGLRADSDLHILTEFEPGHDTRRHFSIVRSFFCPPFQCPLPDELIGAITCYLRSFQGQALALRLQGYTSVIPR